MKKIKTQVKVGVTLHIHETGSWCLSGKPREDLAHDPGSRYKKGRPVRLWLHVLNPPKNQKQWPALCPHWWPRGRS